MMRGGTLLASCIAGLLLIIAPATGQQRDYLTTLEADKIRDAEAPSLRIKLFVEFASDRLKKFQYEMERPSSDRRKTERLNDLLNAYTSCVDDAAELIELGMEKSQDIREGVKEMQAKGKEFLAYLDKLSASGTDTSPFKDTLDDALTATKEALADAEKAAKEMSPPPVRRKP